MASTNDVNLVLSFSPSHVTMKRILVLPLFFGLFPALFSCQVSAPVARACVSVQLGGLGELGGAASGKRLGQQLASEGAKGDYGSEAVVEDIIRALGRIEDTSARAPLVRRLERLAARVTAESAASACA